VAGALGQAGEVALIIFGGFATNNALGISVGLVTSLTTMVGLSTGIGIGQCLVSSGSVSSCSVMFNTVETINASTIIARSASANGSHGSRRASGSMRERIRTMSVRVVTGNSSEDGTISVSGNSSGSVNLRACACAAGGAD